MKRKQYIGFTLIELLVAMAVFAILVTVGVPAMKSFMRDNRLASQTNELVGALNAARSEAVRRGANVTVCSSTDEATCSGTNAWATGWIAFTDLDGNIAINGSDAMIRVHGPVGGGDTITSQGFDTSGTAVNTSYVQYNSRGNINGLPQTFTICDTEPGNVKRARGVNVLPTGLIALAKDTSNDGIVNDVASNNVACP
ncbi:MAG: GspH/FimT family pseudopilin [Gammaproteobacteria bacterium]